MNLHQDFVLPRDGHFALGHLEAVQPILGRHPLLDLARHAESINYTDRKSKRGVDSQTPEIGIGVEIGIELNWRSGTAIGDFYSLQAPHR